MSFQQHARQCRHALTATVLLVLATLALPGLADYPERPLRFIVPQAAGSATDSVARLLSPALSQQLGQQVVIDNRPGGALTIGIELAARAAPDGYTIALGPVGALAINRTLVKTSYDVDRDLVPIAQVTSSQILLAVAPSLPVTTVRELIAHAKANPGKLTNASSSNGSPGHVSGELFKFMTGTEIVHVPYKGGAQAINDLIAGHVQLMFESLNSIAPHARGGKIRALAVSGAQRSPALPDIPTLAESGVPGYEVTTWTGVIGPAGLPRTVVSRLNAEVNRTLNATGTKEKFAAIGSEFSGGTPEQFGELIRRDAAKWAEVVKRSGTKID